MRVILKLSVLIFFLCLQNIPALDIEITKKEIQAIMRNEYNRDYNYFGELSSIAVLELNNIYTVKSGLAIGLAKDITEIKLFSGFNAAPIRAVKNLSFSIAYIYDKLPQYYTYMHTILPFVSYNARRAGVSIGPGFRFTSYFDEKALYEALISFSVYFNFINNEKVLFGISVANFDDFNVKNTLSYSIKLNSAVYLNKNWSLINELEYSNSGIDGLTATFYGIAWRGGAKFTW